MPSGIGPDPGISLFLRSLLLSGDGPAGPRVGPGIRMCPLATDGQSTAMAESPITSDVHESLDVHGHIGAKGPLDLEGPFDLTPEKIDLFVGEILGSPTRINSTCVEDLHSPGPPDSIDVGQGDLNSLTPGQVNARNTCHRIVSVVQIPG